jgi:pyruvate/2-oxoglutarate/acetoin dehydrogenase E1 component
MDGVLCSRVAALDLPIGNSRSLEDVILPSVKDIVDAAVSLVNKKTRHNSFPGDK